MSKIIQLGNFLCKDNSNMPIRGRVFSSHGCAPTVFNYAAGGGAGLENSGMEVNILIIGSSTDGAGTSIINFKTMDMEEKDKDYVEFKEAVIRYAVDKKLYSGEEHDYVPTTQMLADDGVKGISRMRMLHKALCERYGEDKATSCPLFRIRKLTPREVFRLMNVDDADIDKIFAYRYPDNEYETDCYGNEVINVETDKRQKHRMGQPISNSKLYQLAGNSIVVNCMYYIFKNLFVTPTFSAPNDNGYKVDEHGQLSLF